MIAMFAAFLALVSAPLFSDLETDRVLEPIAPRNIQILLEKEIDGALLEVQGPYYIFNPENGNQISSGASGKRFMIHETDNGLKWGEEFPGVHQIYIKPKNNESLFVNGIQYDGAIAVYGFGHTVNIVNDIAIESFVKSMLAMQMQNTLEPEVVSAMAILARTDAYYCVLNAPMFCYWHLNAKDISFQGSALIGENSPIQNAVENTRHLILVQNAYGNHLPFPCTWTENCAGKTASYEAIFRKEGTPKQGVEAPHAKLGRSHSKWSYQIGKKTLSSLLDMAQITGIELFVEKQSSKVYGIRVSDGKTHNDIDFFTLQNLLGKKSLQSSDFSVSLKDQMVVFEGYGTGHGVGLCLYSANALAQNGENAVKILSKFFPETYLYNLNAIPQ